MSGDIGDGQLSRRRSREESFFDDVDLETSPNSRQKQTVVQQDGQEQGSMEQGMVEKPSVPFTLEAATPSAGGPGLPTTSQNNHHQQQQQGQSPWLPALLATTSRLRDYSTDYQKLELIQDQLLQTRPTGHATGCKILNRYSDVHPYDDNRVKLEAPLPSYVKLPCPQHLDYINASFLRNLPGDVPWQYIATQGPLPYTVSSFWQMVVQQNVPTVVMLTNLTERGVPKCELYFGAKPGDAVQFEDYRVKTIKAVKYGTEIVFRQLQVSVAGQPEPHLVNHYHFRSWADHSVPSSVTPIKLLSDLLKSSGSRNQPIAVHCSAGIGRTGVFTVLDIVLRRLEALGPRPNANTAAKAVDLYTLVQELRQQRPGMVQTSEQYKFCHEAVQIFLKEELAKAAT